LATFTSKALARAIAAYSVSGSRLQARKCHNKTTGWHNAQFQFPKFASSVD
jgi:hypothetical protein